MTGATTLRIAFYALRCAAGMNSCGSVSAGGKVTANEGAEWQPIGEKRHDSLPRPGAKGNKKQTEQDASQPLDPDSMHMPVRVYLCHDRRGRGVTVLLGPNGAGKSTLICALVGLLALEVGSLEFDGAGTARRNGALRELIGYVPQEISLPAGAALRDVVAYAAWLQRIGRRERDDRVAAALAAVRLSEQARTPVGRLSGGMRRRAMLACAIVHGP